MQENMINYENNEGQSPLQIEIKATNQYSRGVLRISLAHQQHYELHSILCVEHCMVYLELLSHLTHAVRAVSSKIYHVSQMSSHHFQMIFVMMCLESKPVIGFSHLMSTSGLL